MRSQLDLKETESFIPFQPEIKYIMDNYDEDKPSSHNIALYYQFFVPENTFDSFSLIPDGCFDIVFCCCEENLAAAYVWTSPTERSEEFELKQNCRYFGIRFLPEQNLIDFKSPMKNLLGKQIPLKEAFSIAPEAIEDIAKAKSLDEKICIFENFLDNFAKQSKAKTILDYCIKQIYLFKGNMSISNLMSATGYSDRYIRNIFERYIGFSPKQFSEIVRFQNSLSMMLKADNAKIIDIIHENGYHDQAHFIRNFKKFVPFPPNQYKKLLLG